MLRIRLVLLLPPLVIIIMLMGFSCSSMNVNPVALTDVVEEDAATPARDTADMYVGGLWQVGINKDTGVVNINRQRGADLALNALSFIEQSDGAFGDVSFSINEINPADGHVNTDVTISHQFYSGNGKYNVFDVRGIAIGADVVNADGYTPLLRPLDFGDVPYGYINSEIGTPAYLGGFNDEVYPYKYFADGLTAEQSPADFFSNSTRLIQRGAFTEGAVNTRRYDMYLNVDSYGNFVFNYAILINHDFPTGNPPYELADYPLLTANCAEPFYIDCDIIHDALFYDYATGIGGGTLTMDVEVYDWQALGDVTVTIESPGVMSPVTVGNYGSGSTFKSGVFSFVNIPMTPVAVGPIDVIITAKDTAATFGGSFFHGFLPESHALYNEPAYISTKLTLDVQEPTLNEKALYLLSGITVPDESFTFVVWGDCRDDEGRFDDVTAKINSLNPAFSIGTGDYITFGTRAEFDAFIPRLDALNQPLINVPGNHEYPDNGRQIWLSEFGTTNFSFDFGGVRFICLDNADLILDELELAFLESKLNTNMPTMVFAHCPPDYGRWSVHSFSTGSAEFLNLMTQYGVDYAIFGHIHLYDEMMIGSTQCVVSGGAGAPLRFDYGFGILQYHVVKVTVAPGSIRHEFVPIY